MSSTRSTARSNPVSGPARQPGQAGGDAPPVPEPPGSIHRISVQTGAETSGEPDNNRDARSDNRAAELPGTATDRVHIDRARHGDRSAFAEMVHKYQGSVYRQAWRILTNEQDAEDAAQETFLRAWKSLDSFDGTREFRPWILRIATNTALTMWKRRSNRRTIGGDDRIEDLPDHRSASPAESLDRRELARRGAEVLASLSPEKAALFNLRYGEGLSTREIAEVLGRKPNAVAVSLHRLRERFGRLLAGKEKEGES